MKVFFKTPLGLITLAIALALVLPVLMMDGMFMDATMYTAVGHNLANGYGTPWFLYYSTAHTLNVPGFFENPPLGYWIFAIFFKIFGDSLFVERFYVLLTYLLSMFLIIRIWKLVKVESREISWLPVFLWSIVPLTFWAYTQNIMENTMALFVLGAIICGIKSASAQSKSYGWAIGSGLFVFLAFMVKGFPGMYPLATVVIYWLVYRNISFRKMLGLSLVMTAMAVVPVLVLYSLPVSGDSLYYYLFVRTFGRIKHIPTVDSRFKIVWELIQQMILPMAVIGVTLFISKFRAAHKIVFNKKAFWFLLLLGLCGVLPLCLTKVQRGFYLVPAIPVVAMALAVVIARPVRLWQQKIASRTAKGIYWGGGMLLVAVLMASFILAGKPKREADLLADVNAIGETIGYHDTITAPESITHDWSVKAYLMRYYFIQMEHKAFNEGGPAPDEWLLLDKSENPPFPGYKKIRELNRFDLYRKETN